MVEDVLPPTPAKEFQDYEEDNVWMVPMVAGRSGQWMEEAEGGSSAAAGAPKTFFYFLSFGWLRMFVVSVMLLRENKIILSIFGDPKLRLSVVIAT